MELLKEIKEHRKTAHKVDPLILNRWSPRSMTGEDLTEEQLMTLFEAARWAPSSYNNQPWRFLFARKNTPHWFKLFDLMGEFNQGWAKHASALVVVAAKKTFDHNSKPSVTHAFDTGAAWGMLALQAVSMGLVTHGMEGFDYYRARQELNIPDDHEVLAMIAIGKQAPKERLPGQLQEKELPSGRKELDRIAFEGEFKPSA